MENENELNKFLRSKKIIHVDSLFVSNNNYCGWMFTIQYIDTEQNIQKSFPLKEKVDYKNVLDENTFAQFSKLREVRKKMAQDDAVPAYAVFTNEELAEIAKLEELNEKALLTINGIGEKRIEKYGKLLIELIKE